MHPAMELLTTWAPDPVAGTGILACAAGYLALVRAGDRRHPDRPWERRRTAGFLTGLGLIALVLMGPPGAFDDVFFWAHMIQHLVLMMVAAPLLLLGSPVLLLLRASGPRLRREWLVPLLRSRALRGLTRPAVAWILFSATLLGTHFSPFYDYATSHPLVHRFVEHPLYLTVALIYYYPLIGANPTPHRVPPITKLISLVTMMAPETMTGFFLYSATHVFYPAYLIADRPFGLSPLRDQQLGGALMWAGGMVLDAVWVALAAREWLRAEERAARRSDAELAAVRRATLAAARLTGLASVPDRGGLP
jgi:cytochrome c oxidase assembly factor CtaG